MTTTQRLLTYRQRLQAFKKGLDNNDPLATWGGEPKAADFGLGQGPARYMADRIRDEVFGTYPNKWHNPPKRPDMVAEDTKTPKTPPRAVSAPLRGGLEDFPSTPAETKQRQSKKDDES